MKVLIMFPEASGVGWYRQTQPAMQLQKLGCEIKLFPYQQWKNLSIEHQEAIRWADVLHVSRLKQPWVIEILRDTNPRAQIVYDIDDDLLHLPEENVAKSWFGPGDREGIKATIHACDLIICSTEPLAETLRSYNPNQVVIPNAIDPVIFSEPLAKADGHVRVGWAGSMTHVEDVKPMLEGLKMACEEVGYEKLRPCFMGMLAAQMKESFHPGLTYWQPPVTINQYYPALASMGLDIGLAPIRPHSFNNCKSDVKYLEYSAVGAATIASDFGPYKRSIKNGFNGILVSHNSAAQWKKAIIRLFQDVQLRREMVAQAVNFCVHERDPETLAYKYLGVLNTPRPPRVPARPDAGNSQPVIGPEVEGGVGGVTSPTLTIGILSWTPDEDRLKSLMSCLTHILGRVRWPKAKVVILDQGSTAAASDWITREVEAARNLHGLEVHHLIRLMNKGVPAIEEIFKEFPADFFMKVDDDIVPPVGFDRIMMETYLELEKRGDPIGLMSLDVQWGHETFGTRDHRACVARSEITRAGHQVHWLKDRSTAVGMCRLERASKYWQSGGHPKELRYGTDQILTDRFSALGLKNCHLIPLIQRRPGGASSLMPLVHLGATSDESRAMKRAELHKMKEMRGHDAPTPPILRPDEAVEVTGG